MVVNKLLTRQGAVQLDSPSINVITFFVIYFISNRFQPYTLEIENKSPVETFNIHFGEAFSEGLFSALLTSSDTILNNGLHQKAVTVSFHNQLFRKDATFIALVRQLQANARKGFDKMQFEEHLGALLLNLVKQPVDASF